MKNVKYNIMEIIDTVITDKTLFELFVLKGFRHIIRVVDMRTSRANYFVPENGGKDER